MGNETLVGNTGGGPPAFQRAEEIVAEVYRQILESRDAGGDPRRIVMNRQQWETVDAYRRRLGILEGPFPDYLSEEGLFGLEIWYGDGPEIRVE